MKKYLAYYETEWPANIAELTAVENKPFVGVCGKEVLYTVIPEPVAETLKIYYTSSDGNTVAPYQSDIFGANIVNNTYENGEGVIVFDAPVTSIGKTAFYECSSLTSVTIPESVTSIGDGAFYDCPGLISVAIPNGVKNIGKNAFYNCKSMKSVIIPLGVTSIGETTFSGCYSLTSVTIPNSVTSIGTYAFLDCSSLTSITIPNSVTSIGYGAFQNCSSWTSVTIPNSVTSISSKAFLGCYKLSKTNYVGDIADWCNIKFGDRNSNPINYSRNFYINGQEIKDLIIPNGVTSIGNYAFYLFSSLTSITIPNSVTSIGGNAFCNCSSLTSVTIPSSVTSIGKYAFYGCKAMTSIICEALTPPTLSTYNNLSNVTAVYVPAESVDAYKAATNWSYYADKIQPIS